MHKAKIAVLDLYKGENNQEVRQLLDLTQAQFPTARIDTFDLRQKLEFPDLSYGLFLVSGGPGDPRDPEGLFAEMFGQWLDGVLEWNRTHTAKRPVLLICHAFQLACLHFGIAQITPRKSPAFGVYPVHLTDAGAADPVLGHLDNPFYAADFRSFQVVAPDEDALRNKEMHILALEKIRPHVPLERAIMAVRFSEYMLGVQFHPEVAPAAMRRQLKDPKRKDSVVQEDGLEKYQKMLKYLNDTTKMSAVYQTLLSAFFQQATFSRRE